MNLIIFVEYLVNLYLLLTFNMHMFQLNSYAFAKHRHWIKKNFKKVLIQFGFILVATVLNVINNNIANIISIVILLISIIYNMPKGKSKIPLKVTHRVARMFATETIILAVVFSIKGFLNYALIKLGLANILAFILCIIANYINAPIEKMVRNSYINDAKKILRGMPNLTVIGVTGSYGKTSMKNFLAKTLSAKYEVLTTPLNYNTTMGVVKTIRENLKPTHQIFICEMGATKLGDIKEICDLVNPKIGIITSIGPQHLETFKSIENVIKTKFELAESVEKNNGTVFLNYNNEYIAKVTQKSNYIYYGIDSEIVNCNAYDIMSTSKGLSFKIKDEDGEHTFTTKVIGKHNVINITGAIAVSNFLGIPCKNLVSRVREIKAVDHRLQLISRDNIAIIDDSYNSNPVSSKSAIDTLAEFKGNKIIVTPGLIELGEKEEKYNYEFGEYMSNVCDYIFLVGEKQSKAIYEGIKSKNYDESKIFKVNSPQEAMQKIIAMNLKDEVTVLLENDLPDNYNL